MNVDTFLQAARRDCAYNDAAKRAFHRHSRAMLKLLADELGYQPQDYDLRSNKGGIAVSGEITLHSDTLWVQFSQFPIRPEKGFMWRTVAGRMDYVGGPNQWARWESLHDLPSLAAAMRRHVRTTLVAE